MMADNARPNIHVHVHVHIHIHVPTSIFKMASYEPITQSIIDCFGQTDD